MPSLDAGTIAPLLLDDASVCGASNASAFATLRDMLQQRHRKVRKPAFDRLNKAATSLIVDAIVEGLRMQTSGPAQALKRSDPANLRPSRLRLRSGCGLQSVNHSRRTYPSFEGGCSPFRTSRPPF